MEKLKEEKGRRRERRSNHWFQSRHLSSFILVFFFSLPFEYFIWISCIFLFLFCLLFVLFSSYRMPNYGCLRRSPLMPYPCASWCIAHVSYTWICNSILDTCMPGKLASPSNIAIVENQIAARSNVNLFHSFNHF